MWETLQVSACEAMIDALNKVNKQNFTCMHSPDLCKMSLL